jgi:hypothetical protein
LLKENGGSKRQPALQQVSSIAWLLIHTVEEMGDHLLKGRSNGREEVEHVYGVSIVVNCPLMNRARPARGLWKDAHFRGGWRKLTNAELAIWTCVYRNTPYKNS